MKKPVQTLTTRKALIRRTILLFAVFALAGFVSYPKGADWVVDRVNQASGWKLQYVHFPLVLGLDLQGGTHLEYIADLSNVPEAEKRDSMNGVRDVIERRVNAMGVSEPLVQITKAGNDWRLSVELAGIRDIQQAIKMIGETPTLDFREENEDADKPLTEEERKQIDEKNAEQKKKAEDAYARVKNGASFEDIAKQESDDETSKAKGGDLGFLIGQGAYRGLLERLKPVAVGSVFEGVVDDGANYYVAKVEERKPAGQEIRASHILIQWAGSSGSSSTSTKEQAKARIEELKKTVTAENFDEMVQKFSQEPGANQSKGDLDWFAKGVMVPEFEETAFKLAKDQISDVLETQFGFHLIKKTDERPLDDIRVRVVIYKKTQPSDIRNTEPWKRTHLTGKQLQRAQLEFDQRTGASQVSLQFDDEGAKLFADLTKKNVGKPIAIFLDDQPISIPTVQQEITGGNAVINGSFTIAEAKLLAQRLQAGALPVPISIIAQQSVGPTLGSESVAASLRAGLIGFLFVAFFMLMFYRLPGLISVLALAFYAALLLALFKLIPVTMTLSGIAGFILSLGMAVDANVLIFERLKEEFREGKTTSHAIDEAFKRAWTSIRDGNATTLISCAVLYGFSSSIIKGFALTLAIGVVMSMFTAIVVTKTLLKLVAAPSLVEKMPWLFLKKKSDS
ncbi:protein-export membrane protein SecD [Candidatus Uhrbacteria bacterium RIFCSPHIGHO2_12_FULL_60_25]|uniref:Protein translocase subunit SecD n=1 Tax=Candidatus Uhrbacteria bacterium RIFCSPHIGHO2_12_FULL_60_25 TaxID=1802399 RepID=A0A1F7UMT8_9BACT|nr:MAG: protein-export membrane protein SecD [Candidatus Uhrbacteria bacterium RIFCSPHIGHO2_02_FULL_60_44]OGL79074.1 MAG: protein-export membrane protein SecD [Candidatus Uhrbacteria bacterium RIFCSPHIGHO2_12_FULL_60_25]